MTKILYTINTEDGVRKAERLMDEKRDGCLPVYEDGHLVGIITSKDIIKAHPNRIVADAMTSRIILVAPSTSLWEAQEILEENNIERLLVIEDERLVGIVTNESLFAELGKYIDLLTGLYKSDYIYYQGAKYLVNGMEISVIFIDLDKFGYIDKEYGHTFGDNILNEMGNLLKVHVPDDTHLCRFGGDEFVILTPYKINKCRLLADNLLDVISMQKFYGNINITASAGIAGGKRCTGRECDPVNTVEALINLASLASTKAKMEKIRVVITEGLCAPESA